MRHPPCHAPSSSIASIIRCRLFPACSFTAAHQNARFTKTPQLASWGAAAGSGTHTTSTCNELLASHSALVNTESKGGAAAGGRDVVMLMAFQLLSHITPHARRLDRGSTSCTPRRPDGRGVVARGARAPTRMTLINLARAEAFAFRTCQNTLIAFFTRSNSKLI